MKAVLCFALVGAALAKSWVTKPAVDNDLIHAVNKAKSTWTAGHNPHFEGRTMAFAKGLMGYKKSKTHQLPKKDAAPAWIALPTAFDSRTQWGSMCPSTMEVRDQSACGSCWAFGAVESMTDRHCIQSMGKNTPHISADDMNSCCWWCGNGCGGGDPGSAWSYWVQTGVVDGGNYEGGGCDPYALPGCDHHLNNSANPCPANEYPTPACQTACQNSETWAAATHTGSSAYQLATDQNSIMQEIMTNGPVEAAFTVYQDFLAYKSGVYQYTTGAELGGHAIKILGWGVDNGTPYWTVANSWNSDWGNQGFFNILRGADECGIEDDVNAGMAKN
jgi:cathepsin B